jgi:glycosyltransferase involved in cell wall biosynthesis
VVEALVQEVREGAFDAVVGDELCFRELGPAFEALAGGPARVLLVHHLTRWEIEGAGGLAAAGEGGRAGDGVLATLAEEQRALDGADLCVATSAETAARLAREGHRGPLAVVVPGADRLPALPRSTPDDGAARLLFVGNLVPRKNVLLLLAAFERGASPSARLAIVGDPGRDLGYAGQVRRTIERSARLAGAVDRVGAVDEAALAAALSCADALVLPSSLEGYGMVLTEALAAGLPVLCTRGCAAAAQLEESGAAVVVAPDDLEALAGAISGITRDAALRARLRAAASAVAPSLPRWKDAAAAFRAALGRAIVV